MTKTEFYNTASSVANSLGNGFAAMMNSAVALLDVRNYVKSITENTRDTFDLVTGLNKFEYAFPNLNRLIFNPRKQLEIEINSAKGTWLSAKTWTENPLRAFDSAAVSFGATLPQAAAMVYGVGPLLTRGPTVGQFAQATAKMIEDAGRAAVKSMNKIGDFIFPPSLLTTNGFIMPVPYAIAAEAGAVSAAGIGMSGGSLSPLNPVSMAMAASGAGGGVRKIRSKNWVQSRLNGFREIAERIVNDTSRCREDRVFYRGILEDIERAERFLDNGALFKAKVEAQRIKYEIKNYEDMPRESQLY